MIPRKTNGSTKPAASSPAIPSRPNYLLPEDAPIPGGAGYEVHERLYKNTHENPLWALMAARRALIEAGQLWAVPAIDRIMTGHLKGTGDAQKQLQAMGLTQRRRQNFMADSDALLFTLFARKKEVISWLEPREERGRIGAVDRLRKWQARARKILGG
jgi:hypothetical protein